MFYLKSNIEVLENLYFDMEELHSKIYQKQNEDHLSAVAEILLATSEDTSESTRIRNIFLGKDPESEKSNWDAALEKFSFQMLEIIETHLEEIIRHVNDNKLKEMAVDDASFIVYDLLHGIDKKETDLNKRKVANFIAEKISIVLLNIDKDNCSNPAFLGTLQIRSVPSFFLRFSNYYTKKARDKILYRQEMFPIVLNQKEAIDSIVDFLSKIFKSSVHYYVKVIMAFNVETLRKIL